MTFFASCELLCLLRPATGFSDYTATKWNRYWCLRQKCWDPCHNSTGRSQVCSKWRVCAGATDSGHWRALRPSYRAIVSKDQNTSCAHFGNPQLCMSVCLSVFNQPLDVGTESCWMSSWQMLNASVGLGAPVAEWGCVCLHMCVCMYIYPYLYTHICTCVYVSDIENTVHLVVLVYALIRLDKTFVLCTESRNWARNQLVNVEWLWWIFWEQKKSCINQRWQAAIKAWKLKHLWEAVVYSALFVYFVWEINLAILVLDLCIPFIRMLICCYKSYWLH